MFRPRDFWRHRNCLDLDLRIVKVEFRGTKYWKLRVTYLNRHNGIVYNDIPESVKIQKDQWKFWSLIKE